MLRHVSDIRPERICATYGVVSPPAGGVGTSGSSLSAPFLRVRKGLWESEKRKTKNEKRKVLRAPFFTLHFSLFTFHFSLFTFHLLFNQLLRIRLSVFDDAHEVQSCRQSGHRDLECRLIGPERAQHRHTAPELDFVGASVGREHA